MSNNRQRRRQKLTAERNAVLGAAEGAMAAEAQAHMERVREDVGDTR